MGKIVVCFFTLSAGDWGGASRVLFTNLRMMSREVIHPILLLPNKGPILAELKQEGISHRIWGQLTEPGNPFAYAKALWRAIRLYRSEKVKLVHVNGSVFWRPAELLAARLCRIPIVTHYHVIENSPAPFIALCHAAICVSRYTADQSLPKELTKAVVYNPVDLKRFDGGRTLRRDLAIADDAIVVAFLGQIREVKGVQDFIAMAKEIPDPNVIFIIAGECRDPKKFTGSYSEEQLVEMADQDPRVRYIGYITRAEDVYHTADIIVVPSRWQEPLGLINLEAGACSKPVVATNVGGIPEVVIDGVNGYLVEPGDVRDLAKCVQRLVANPDLRDRMGSAGRKLVEENFTYKPVKAFEELLVRFARH